MTEILSHSTSMQVEMPHAVFEMVIPDFLYERSIAMDDPGHSITSEAFGSGSGGEPVWRLACFPNFQDKGHVGAFLRYEGPLAVVPTMYRMGFVERARAGGDLSKMRPRGGTLFNNKGIWMRLMGRKMETQFQVETSWGFHSLIQSGHLPQAMGQEDSVRIRVEAWWVDLGDDFFPTAAPYGMGAGCPQLAPGETRTVGAAVEAIRHTNCDITLACKDGSRVLAHRAILRARSPVFCAMLSSTYNFQEAQGGLTDAIIPVSTMSGEGVQAAVEFMYTDELRAKTTREAEDAYVAGQFYAIDGLVQLAEDYLLQHMTPANSVEMLRFASAHGATELEERAMELLLDGSAVGASPEDLKSLDPSTLVALLRRQGEKLASPPPAASCGANRGDPGQDGPGRAAGVVGEGVPARPRGVRSGAERGGFGRMGQAERPVD